MFERFLNIFKTPASGHLRSLAQIEEGGHDDFMPKMPGAFPDEKPFLQQVIVATSANAHQLYRLPQPPKLAQTVAVAPEPSQCQLKYTPGRTTPPRAPTSTTTSGTLAAIAEPKSSCVVIKAHESSRLSTTSLTVSPIGSSNTGIPSSTTQHFLPQMLASPGTTLVSDRMTRLHTGSPATKRSSRVEATSKTQRDDAYRNSGRYFALKRVAVEREESALSSCSAPAPPIAAATTDAASGRSASKTAGGERAVRSGDKAVRSGSKGRSKTSGLLRSSLIGGKGYRVVFQKKGAKMPRVKRTVGQVTTTDAGKQTVSPEAVSIMTKAHVGLDKNSMVEVDMEAGTMITPSPSSSRSRRTSDSASSHSASSHSDEGYASGHDEAALKAIDQRVSDPLARAGGYMDLFSGAPHYTCGSKLECNLRDKAMAAHGRFNERVASWASSRTQEQLWSSKHATKYNPFAADAWPASLQPTQVAEDSESSESDPADYGNGLQLDSMFVESVSKLSMADNTKPASLASKCIVLPGWYVPPTRGQMQQTNLPPIGVVTAHGPGDMSTRAAGTAEDPLQYAGELSVRLNLQPQFSAHPKGSGGGFRALATKIQNMGHHPAASDSSPGAHEHASLAPDVRQATSQDLDSMSRPAHGRPIDAAASCSDALGDTTESSSPKPESDVDGSVSSDGLHESDYGSKTSSPSPTAVPTPHTMTASSDTTASPSPDTESNGDGKISSDRLHDSGYGPEKDTASEETTEQLQLESTMTLVVAEPPGSPNQEDIAGKAGDHGSMAKAQDSVDVGMDGMGDATAKTNEVVVEMVDMQPNGQDGHEAQRDGLEEPQDEDMPLFDNLDGPDDDACQEDEMADIESSRGDPSDSEADYDMDGGQSEVSDADATDESLPDAENENDYDQLCISCGQALMTGYSAQDALVDDMRNICGRFECNGPAPADDNGGQHKMPDFQPQVIAAKIDVERAEEHKKMQSDLEQTPQLQLPNLELDGSAEDNHGVPGRKRSRSVGIPIDPAILDSQAVAGGTVGATGCPIKRPKTSGSEDITFSRLRDTQLDARPETVGQVEHQSALVASPYDRGVEGILTLGPIYAPPPLGSQKASADHQSKWTPFGVTSPPKDAVASSSAQHTVGKLRPDWTPFGVPSPPKDAASSIQDTAGNVQSNWTPFGVPSPPKDGSSPAPDTVGNVPVKKETPIVSSAQLNPTPQAYVGNTGGHTNAPAQPVTKTALIKQWVRLNNDLIKDIKLITTTDGQFRFISHHLRFTNLPDKLDTFYWRFHQLRAHGTNYGESEWNTIKVPLMLTELIYEATEAAALYMDEVVEEWCIPGHRGHVTLPRDICFDLLDLTGYAVDKPSYMTRSEARQAEMKALQAAMLARGESIDDDESGSEAE
ncbi:hypothetical protein LTR85_002558 [Meristemomyces frigidus]|nr:hypothetical protein LTR85_002558 [Meristemomyces frigidus]